MGSSRGYRGDLALISNLIDLGNINRNGWLRDVCVVDCNG